YFQKGWVHVRSPALFTRPAQSRIEIYEGGAHHRYTSPLAEPLTAWHYREEAVFFIRALRSGEPFLSSGDDTLTDVRLHEEIYKKYLGFTN
ncbi:MAG TPA: hypothetical protein VJU82_16100, partial [Acidobacteriaceae bacterium]|nr:hypothetical protein [Acidobacteriaceae bacterium]